MSNPLRELFPPTIFTTEGQVDGRLVDTFFVGLAKAWTQKERAPARTDLVTLLARRGEQLQRVSQSAAREWEEVLFE